jgi:hypothetical protein
MSSVTSYQEYLDSFYALASAEPEALGAVYEKVNDKCRVALALQFTTKTLLFTANPDDDTISVRFGNPRSSNTNARSLNTTAWTRSDARRPWKSLIGAAFGWGWITINQQGYCDGVLLSFDGVLPTIMLCVIRSSITIRRIVEEDQRIASSK